MLCFNHCRDFRRKSPEETICRQVQPLERKGYTAMKHVKTLNTPRLKESCAMGGCGECQASCQSVHARPPALLPLKCENAANMVKENQ